MKKKNMNLSEWVEDFRNLKPKEYYAWPISAQLGVGVSALIVTTLLGTFLDLIPLKDELSASVEKEGKLKDEFVEKKKQAINLPLYKEQLDQVTRDSDNLLKQLPNKSQMEKLLIDVNQAAIGRGLKVELFKPGTEKVNEFYAELPIELKMSGSYDAIGNFTSDTAQLSRVVLFTDMNVATKEGTVTLTATAKTFRYLDTKELEEQAKKKAESQKGKRKQSANNGEGA